VVFFQEKGESGCYVKPAIAEAKIHLKLYNTVLYLLKYSGTVENALELQNGWLKDYHLRL
jgi:aldehyde dehydrogenase (NAD+)